MAVRASKPRYVHSSAVSRCEGETSFNQIQVGGQGGRSEASRWGKPSVCAWTREGQDAFLAYLSLVMNGRCKCGGTNNRRPLVYSARPPRLRIYGHSQPAIPTAANHGAQ